MLITHCRQHVQAAALIWRACIAVLRPWSAPGRHGAEQLGHPLCW